MSAKKPSSQQIWGIVEKMGTKIALVNEHSQLQEAIVTYLPQLLSLLSFPDTTVRNKVVEVLTHINKRVRQDESIKLPLLKILDLYLSPTDNPFVKNFSNVYVEMAFQRSSHEEKATVLPTLLKGISTKVEPQQGTLLRHMLEGILYTKIPQTEEECLEKFASIKEENNDLKALLHFLRDVLLSRSNYKLTGEILEIPEGLSVGSLKRVVGEKGIDSKQLTERKNAIINFITCGIFSDNIILPLLIVGSTDGQEPLTSTCENKIKKLANIDMEDPELIDNLFELYTGKKNRRTPISVNLKVKIIYYLTKSRLAANKGESTKDVLVDSLFSEFAAHKLKVSGMQFLIHILNEGKVENTESFAKDIFILLIDSINKLSGASSANLSEFSIIQTMKENFYTALGSMAKKFPQFVRDKFYIVKLYFDGLVKEEPRVKIAIQQGLSSLIDAYKSPDQELQSNFETLFLKIVLEPNRNSHAVSAVLRCTNRLFPFDHIPSRFMCLLCVDDQSLQVREEASRGSDMERFTKYRQLDTKEEFHHPQFVTVVDYVHNFIRNPQGYALSSGSHMAIIEFMRKTMAVTAQENKQNLENYVKSLRQNNPKVIDAYTYCLQTAFTEYSSADLLLEASDATMNLASMDMDHFGPKFADQFGFIQRFMFNGDEQSREKTGRLVAFLYMFMDPVSKASLLKHLKENMTNSTEANMHGSILTLGNICALTYKKNRDPVVPEDLKGVVEDIVDLIVIGSHRPLIVHASYSAVGEIAHQGALCYLGQSREHQSADYKRKLTTEINSKLELVNVLIEQMKKEATPNKTKEKIIGCLSKICINEVDPSMLDLITNELFSLNTNKAEEIQFTIGEAFSCIAGGDLYCSLYRADEYQHVFTRELTPQEKELQEKLRDQYTTAILMKIVRNGVLNPKKIIRQSSSIWLLTFCKYCAECPYFMKYLKDIQKAYSVLLTDNNEVTNEVAGRGLAYVYELGDKTTQKELVDSLMNSLSGKKNNKDIKLNEETELLLFPEEARGGMDKSMSTYKELVSVANDIGKPEMIYQMLSISNHHAIWNAKKAAAFSAVNIIQFTHDSSELEKVLPTIVPKLYRYQFDPNPIINRSMTDMWKAVVKNPKEAVDKYLPAIAKELISGLDSELWRVREASCYAISDILSGRRFTEVEPFLEKLFTKIFRVTDDVKDSSRKAANSTLRKLGAFSVKSCNPKYTMDREDVKRALNIIVPIYLKTGLLFPVKEVINFSLEHLQQISQVSLQLIKPHITDIIGTLIEQMSALEPAQLNYIQLNADKYNMSQEQLENVRMSLSQSGPISDTISACSRFIDEEVCETLVPRILDILRSGVGLPTRAATAKFLGDLGKFHGNAIKKFVPRLLKGMMTVIQGGSGITEKKVLASSLPYVLKNAKLSQGKLVLEQILALYVNPNDEKNEEDLHFVSGVVMEYITKNVPAIIKKFTELVLPVVFVARHDESKKVSTIWENVWEESISTSPKDMARMYLEPISELCCQLLNHQSWKMKKQGGQGLVELGELVNTDISKPQRVKIINNLLANIPGRAWDGKEILLDALAANCEAYKKDSSFDEEERLLLQKVLEVTLRECNRNNIVFKLQALICLKKVLKVRLFQMLIDDAFYNQAHKLLMDIYSAEVEQEQLTDEEKQKMELEMKKKQKQMEEIRCQILELVPLIVPANNVELFEKEKNYILEKLQNSRLSIQESLSLLQAVYSLVSRVVTNSTLQEQVLSPDQLIEVVKILQQQMDPNQRQVVARGKALEMFSDLIKLLKSENPNLLSAITSTTLELLSDARNREKDATIMLKISATMQLLSS